MPKPPPPRPLRSQLPDDERYQFEDMARCQTATTVTFLRLQLWQSAYRAIKSAPGPAPMEMESREALEDMLAVTQYPEITRERLVRWSRAAADVLKQAIIVDAAVSDAD